MHTHKHMPNVSTKKIKQVMKVPNHTGSVMKENIKPRLSDFIRLALPSDKSS